MGKLHVNISSFFLFLFFFSSCNQSDNYDDMGEVLSLSNIELTDLGQVNPTQTFEMHLEDSVVKCKFRTILIKKGDTIQNFQLELINNKLLRFNVISYPFDFDCVDKSCYTTHEVEVQINKKLILKEYDVELYVNHGLSKDNLFKYKLN